MSLRQISLILISIVIILNSVVYPPAFSTSAERKQIPFVIEIFNKFPELAVLNEMLNILIFNVIGDTGTSSEI